MKKIISTLLILSLLCGNTAGISAAESNEINNTTVASSESVKDKININANFSDDIVIVGIKREYSAYGKVWDPSFFGLDNLVEVEDIGYFPFLEPDPSIISMQELALKFSVKDKMNVLDAIDKLKQMKEVQFACVNMISSYVKPEPIAPAVVIVDTERISYTTGDINGDEKVDLTDLTELSLVLLNESNVSGVYKSAADIDQNGEINIADLARLKQFVSLPDEITLLSEEDRKKYSVEVRDFNIHELTDHSLEYEHDYSYKAYFLSEDRSYGTSYKSYMDVITDYEEFTGYINVSKLPDDAREKYNESYFTNNTLIVYRDDYVTNASDQFVLDLVVTDEQISLRTYERLNGQDDYGLYSAYVFVDIPNDLYKNQKLNYATDRLSF